MRRKIYFEIYSRAFALVFASGVLSGWRRAAGCAPGRRTIHLICNDCCGDLLHRSVHTRQTNFRPGRDVAARTGYVREAAELSRNSRDGDHVP
jgi:hypothetical protein